VLASGTDAYKFLKLIRLNDAFMLSQTWIIFPASG